MISEELKCIFIHIPKTAGTSIEKKLGHFDELVYNVQDHRKFQEIESEANRYLNLRKALHAFRKGKTQRVGGHLQKVLQPKITSHQINTYFKFAFVRNTWGRVYSWYNVLVRDEPHTKMYFPDGNVPDFERYIDEFLKTEEFSQLSYLTNRRGKIAMDFVGRFENLQSDFSYVAETIGLEDDRLPALLKYNYQHYTEVYTDRSRERVAELFNEEIDYFQFRFGE